VSLRARPPALTRLYCRYQVPLDLTEDQLYGSKENLDGAVSQLDENGWNTSGHISAISWSRALFMITPVREEILEIALGVENQTTQERPEYVEPFSLKAFANFTVNSSRSCLTSPQIIPRGYSIVTLVNGLCHRSPRITARTSTL
jgi:hypothetical protein